MTRIAAQVARRKEQHPDRYCSSPRCLWNLRSGPCPKHPRREEPMSAPRVNGTVFVNLLDQDWREDSGRFIATVNIAGLLMHVEAFPVTEAEDLQTFPDDWDEELNSIYGAVGADGPWETTQVHGRECVIIATPFCN